jgi:hypothetical protein
MPDLPDDTALEHEEHHETPTRSPVSSVRPLVTTG